MNIFIAIMLLLAIVGLVDKILGGARGFGAEFDRGIETMGPLALSLVGIYCIGITFVSDNAAAIATASGKLPFDPSIIIGSILAPDLGGYAIAKQMAATPLVGIFAGILVASTLGCTISFVLPVAMASIHKSEKEFMMRGFIIGIVTLPFGLVVGAIAIGLDIKSLITNITPILVICLALCMALAKIPKITTKFLLGVGNFIRIGSFLLFALVLAGLFVPSIAIADIALVSESFLVVAKITAVVCGAMVLSNIVLTSKVFRAPVNFACKKLKINEPAFVGLILSLATSISMLPLFSRMDTRGKIMNAAFSVGGAFTFGGQLAFTASVQPPNIVNAFIISKLVAGVIAVIIAGFFTKNVEDATVNTAAQV